VKAGEIRYRLTSSLLQAGQPQTLSQLAEQTETSHGELRATLDALVAENLVITGDLVPGTPGPLYGWRERWERESRAGSIRSRRELVALMDRRVPTRDGSVPLDGEAAVLFHGFIIDQYRPPQDKRFLVFLQCSVRRPFSSSPSHASMRRAISTATGFDPARDFESCPVHVVVLASYIGPVPYEFEDVYPANVRAGGVKEFGPEDYARSRPVLAGRLAQYLDAHGDHYEGITSFTEGRYGDVLTEARCIAGRDFPILPTSDGASLVRMGHSTARKYWEKFWIQLYLQLEEWLDPQQRDAAQSRLADLEVEYRR